VSRRGVWTTLAGILLVAVLVAGASASMRPSKNPANDPRLLGKPIEDFRYDYATHCRDKMPPGMKALQKWLESNVRGESWGIYRCEKLGPHNYSLHSVDRAIDWHLDRNVPADKRAAMDLIHTLLASDKDGNYAALARRMGVQGLIFNCRDWWSGMHGMGPYSYCYKPNGHRRHGLDPTQAHENHVHIELNVPGAKKTTSFWRSPLGRRY
jgi:hypothetical protein